MPLGLESSEQVDDYWSQSTRRKIFYSYPNGTAPLTGLLSLMESQETSHPQFGWNEERWIDVRTLTIAGTTANTAFYLGGTTTTAGTTFTPTAGTLYRLYVTSGTGTNFQTDDVITVYGLTINSTSVKTEARFRVISTNTTYLEVEAVTTSPGAVTNNSSVVVGLYVVLGGSAFAEGSRSRTGRYTFPSEIINYTQIHKTAFEMTGTALKEPVKYDKSGDYKNQLKKNGINHLAGIEKTAFWGDRRATTAVDEETGATVRRSYSGGLLWFLKQWELGSVSNGGAFDYGQDNVSAQTDYVTYTNKRIIRLAGATITKSQFNVLMTNLFERTNQSGTWDKLCLCGPGYLAKIADYFERQIQITSLRENGYKGFDFQMTQHTTNSGTVYYKQHPLFSSPEMRNSAFYIDLGYLKYRYLSDRDTDIMQMIQLPDADKRKDQWLSECGFEYAYPEAHMYVENLGGLTLG